MKHLDARSLTFLAIAALAAAAGCGGGSGSPLAPSPAASSSPNPGASATPSPIASNGLSADPAALTLSVSGNTAQQTGSITVTQNGTIVYPTLSGSTCFSTPAPKPSSDPTTPWTNFSEMFTSAGSGQASYTVSGFKAQNPGSCTFSFGGQFGATATVPVTVNP